MACSDPYITYLKGFGYNVVRLPKTDVRPGQLLTHNGKDLTRLGEMADVLASKTVPPPPVLVDRKAADLSGKQSGELSVGIGLSILGTIIGALGGSKLGLDLKYEKATSVVFEFQDVLEDRIELVKLDAFLAAADVNPGSAFVRDLLFADDAYVITSAIKSTKFTVESRSASSKGVEVSVPEIQQLVGANVKVSGSKEKTSKVTYEGALPLVFGFQAVRLDYEEGRYTRFEPVKAGDQALERVVPKQGRKKAPAPMARESLLVTRGAFLRLQD
jgi:hypothetical protein